MRYLRPLLVITLVLVACDSKESSGRSAEPSVEAPASQAATRPGLTLVSYIGDTLLLRLAAPENHTLYLDHCNGAFPWGLEHREGGGWTMAWAAVINQCHSAPIEVAPDSSQFLTGIIHLQPDESIPADTYRVVLYGLYTAHDQANHLRNPEAPLELRTSEPFAFLGAQP